MRRGGRGLWLRVCSLCGVLLLGACSAYTDRIAEFRQAYHAGDLPEADRRIDELIADEIDASVEDLAQDPMLATRMDVEAGNNVLYGLEKATVSLALGRFPLARNLLYEARGYYDAHIDRSIADMFSGLADDEARDYVGHDYEHLLLRVFAGLTEMMEGGEDALAHMSSMDEVQERILNSDFGAADGEGYKPRERYRRLMIGSYFAGVLYEGEGQGREAYLRFQRAEQLQVVPTQLVQAALERTHQGRFAPFGYGALQVVYFGGRGPYYVEGEDEATELAVTLAQVGIAIAGESASALFQARIPVPRLVISDPQVPPLHAAVEGQDAASTELICQLNAVVASQLEANMPWIMARALARRSIKAAAAAVTERAVRKSTDDGLAGLFAGILTNVALTAGERAETRGWTSLPAEIQAARLVLPEGVHRVQLSDGNWTDVRIERGRNSFLFVFRPNLSEPGWFVVDRYSFVPESEPKSAPQEALPQEGPAPADPAPSGEGAAPGAAAIGTVVEDQSKNR